MECAALSAADLCLVPYRALIGAIGIEPNRLFEPEQFAAWLDACNLWLKHQARPERLVRSLPSHKSSALQYERRILEHGEIETRDERHDSMNALVWLQFPLTKLAVSRLHVRESESSSDRTRAWPPGAMRRRCSMSTDWWCWRVMRAAWRCFATGSGPQRGLQSGRNFCSTRDWWVSATRCWSGWRIPTRG